MHSFHVQMTIICYDNMSLNVSLIGDENMFVRGLGCNTDERGEVNQK